MGRLKHPFVLSALCLFLALGTVAKETRSSEPAGDGLKRFGLFPLWLSLPADNPMASEELVSSWTEAVLSDLQNSEAGEWIPLDLPGFADEGSRVRFDTLIGKGLEAGCSGILVLQVHQLDFKTKEVEIGRLSFVNASCEVALTGSLVDVGNRAAAGEFSSESRLKDNNYKGPEPGDVESEPIDSESVRTSLFGKAIAEIRQDLVRKITQNTGIIETRIRPALSRSEAPEGVRFAQESMDLRLTTANDQRFTVQVTNAGDEAETFVVKPLNRIGGVVMGLKGIGSEDEPCRLSPGEWKFIRLIANARPQAAAGAVVLGLVKTPEGDEDESTGTAVHDRMTLNITPGAQPADVDMKVLRQDPATLRAVCQLHNRGREEGTVSVRAGETTGGSVVITPPLEDHPLAAGRSMLFFVQPVFESRSRRIEADVEYDLGGRVLKKRLLFEIPPGKEMFWGVCGTSQSSSGSPGVCLNIGTISLSFKPVSDIDIGKEAKFRFTKFWAWLERIFGSDDHFEAPNHGNVPSGVRGARVRDHVAACLPEDVTMDSTTCPSAAYGSDFLAMVSHQPSGDTTGVSYHQIGVSDPEAFESRVLSQTGHSAFWPEIDVVKDDDRVFAVWEDAVDSGGTAVALRRRSPPDNRWSEVQYLTDHSRRPVDPVVCASASGSAAVAWEEIREDGHRIKIRVSRDHGRTFLPETVFPAQPQESQSWPRCAFHPSGRWLVVYRSERNGRSAIACAALDLEGRIVGEAETLFAAGLSCGEPRLAVNEDGDAFAVWRVGEGPSSEIWFSRRDAAGTSWSPPRRITSDGRYSEYPKIKAFGDTVLVSCHSPVLDGKDLTFQIASLDRGASWNSPKALFSPSPWVEKAVLELHFSLSWPRGDYKPFDTFVRLNGKKVGEILDTVPEGIYLFDIPRDLILCTADEILDNEIEITAPGINSADNILLKSYRLIVKRGLTQIPVFASDQEEADKLAGKYSADVNHGRADLCLSANNLDIPGGALRKGEKIRLDFDVHNLGETAAENVRLMLFRSDPSVAGFNERADKLAEAGLDTVEAGQAQKISLTFPFDPETVSSVHARLRSESSDFNLNNDGFRLSLIDGDSDLPTPLLGTDIPILFQAPSLLQVLEIRDLEGLKDFIVSAAYDKFWNSDLARSFDLEGIKEDLRERFRSDMRERFLERLDSIKDWLEKLRERRR